MTLNVHLTEPQAEFFQSTAKSTAVISGFGAGKTQTLMTRLVSTAIEYPKADFLYVAPTVPLIRDILYPKLHEFLPEVGIKFSINKAENIVHLHGLGKIFCRSGDIPERIVGMEVLDAYIDEIDIMTTAKATELWQKCKARCRQKVYSKYRTGVTKKKKKRKKGYLKLSQQWVASTPEGYKFCYEMFYKNPIKNSHLVRMSTYSNPYLPDDYIEDLIASYPPQLIQAYLNGEFTNLVAAPVWGSFDKKKTVVPGIQVRPVIDPITGLGEELTIGIDFNVGRGCAVIFVKRMLQPGHPNNPTSNKAWPVLIAVDEVFNSYDTPDTIRVLDERYPPHIFKDRVCYPDASGTNRKSVNGSISDIWLLKNNGFQVRKRKKNPQIKSRVAAGNAALINYRNEQRVYVQTETTPNLTDTLIKQVYDKNGLPEKGKGKLDDMGDAFSYPIEYIFPLKHALLREEALHGA